MPSIDVEVEKILHLSNRKRLRSVCVARKKTFVDKISEGFVCTLYGEYDHDYVTSVHLHIVCSCGRAFFDFVEFKDIKLRDFQYQSQCICPTRNWSTVAYTDLTTVNCQVEGCDYCEGIESDSDSDSEAIIEEFLQKFSEVGISGSSSSPQTN
uniref:p1 n=1 Tax=Velvet tobacco mottle virus TaxID=12473 RepID=I7A6P5_9VIRU|nr:P1 [Velvet tobacco mottle virus]